MGTTTPLPALLDPHVIWQGLREEWVCHRPDEVIETLLQGLEARRDVEALEFMRADDRVVMGVRGPARHGRRRGARWADLQRLHAEQWTDHADRGSSPSRGRSSLCGDGRSRVAIARKRATRVGLRDPPCGTHSSLSRRRGVAEERGLSAEEARREAHDAGARAKERAKSRASRAKAEALTGETAEEAIRQVGLIYGGLIGIAVVMVQPFLAAASLDRSAKVSVIAFSVAIPLPRRGAGAFRRIRASGRPRSACAPRALTISGATSIRAPPRRTQPSR
jgi:hypothetical protein